MELLVPAHALVRGFPDYERFELSSQLRRASKSIPANIAEGYGKKRSVKEFKSYLTHALGSANEMIVHLKIANVLGYGDADVTSELIEGYTIVAKQLYTLIGTWQSFGGPPSEPVTHPVSRLQRPASSAPLARSQA